MEAEHSQEECNKLKAEIKSLQYTIKMQEVKLVNLENEKTVTSTAAAKEIDLLKTSIKTLNAGREQIPNLKFNCSS